MEVTKAYKRARDYRGYKKELNFLIQKRGQLMGMVGYIDERMRHIQEAMHPLATPQIIREQPK